MPDLGIIVIGASAGGVEALERVIGGLPGDIDAAVFVVVHIPPEGPSLLARVLGRYSELPVRAAEDGAPIERGVVYVAPPDFHLVLDSTAVRLTRGPRENGHRPAVDALFRSAASVFDGRVVAVVLSGNLDDGTLGTRAVRLSGGATVAQDPDEATYPSMPRNAIMFGGAENIATLDRMAPLLHTLAARARSTARTERISPGERTMDEDAHGNSAAQVRPGTASGFSCPECHGALWEVTEGGLTRYRCRVGHSYTEEHMIEEQDRALEAALWTAIVALEERYSFLDSMVQRASLHGNHTRATRLKERAEDVRRQAAVISAVLRGRPVAVDE